MKKSTGFAWALLGIGVGCCIAAGVMGVNWNRFVQPLIHHGAGAQQVVTTAEMTVETPTANGTITCLDIDMQAANVTVQVGSEWKLEADEYTTWEQIDEDTMYITRTIPSVSGNKYVDVTITVPQAEFQEIDCSIDAGTLTMNGLKVTGEFDCDMDAASAVLTDMTANNADFSAEAGSVDYTGILTGDCSAETDAGSISLYLLAGSDIHTVTGDKKLAGIAVKQDGKILCDGSALIGDLELNTAYTGNGTLDIDCNAGAVDVDMTTK